MLRPAVSFSPFIFYVLIPPLQDKTDNGYPTVAKLNYIVYRHMIYEQNLYFKKKKTCSNRVRTRGLQVRHIVVIFYIVINNIFE
jgi:hypothetical protein